MNFKTILHIVGIMLLFQTLHSQIRELNYQLKFNDKTNQYDCYLVVKKGQAVNPVERIQFNAQITLIIPTNKTLKIAQSYMPLQFNKKYDGEKPLQWGVSNVSRKPAADADHDYVSIVPSLTPTAFYDNMFEGDEVKLFSFEVSPVVQCGAEVRLFDNQMDLNSSSRGLGGGDYSNGFTIGGVEQKYAGNMDQTIPSLDVIDQLSVKASKSSAQIAVSLNEHAIYGPYTYEWFGPENFTSSESQIHTNTLAELTPGIYTVEIKDNRGCVQTKSIEVKSNTPVLTGQDNKTTPESTANLIARENKQVESVRIFPNPAINYFSVQITGENGTIVAIDIRDMAGRIIRNNAFKSVIQNNKLEAGIQLQDIAPGMYNVTVALNQNVSTHKLIVVK